MFGWEPNTALPGAGRRVLVTGANSGLGYATAAALLATGAQVVITTRSEDKARDTRARLAEDPAAWPPAGPHGGGCGSQAPGGPESHLEHDILDLTDLAGVRGFIERHAAGRFDAVIHNAGAMFADFARTDDGLERTYQVHVAAPFLLTAGLLGAVRATTHGRVVTVTSGGLYTARLDVARLTDPAEGYRGATAYAQAKRAQLVLTAEWARRYPRLGVTFAAVHPGWAATDGLAASLPGFSRRLGAVLRTADEGVDTTVRLALSPRVPTPDGGLWHDRRRRGAHRVPWTRSPRGEAGQLWARVCRDTGVTPPPV